MAFSDGLRLGGLVIVFALLPPRGGDDLFFALGDFGLIALAAAPAATAATAGLLRLREFALEGIGLNEEHVAASFGVRVLCGGVDADQIARNEFEVFEAR